MYTAISIKVVDPRAKRKSRIRARKAAGNRLQINEFSKRFPAAFRARIRLITQRIRQLV